jgi:hypothetical protein
MYKEDIRGVKDREIRNDIKNSAVINAFSVTPDKRSAVFNNPSLYVEERGEYCVLCIVYCVWS